MTCTVRIREIARKTKDKQPNFFSVKNMRFFNQSFSDFELFKLSDNTTGLIAPVRDNNKIIAYTVRIVTDDNLHLKNRFSERLCDEIKQYLGIK